VGWGRVNVGVRRDEKETRKREEKDKEEEETKGERRVI